MIATLGCWAVLGFVFFTLGWAVKKSARTVWKREVVGEMDGVIASGAVATTLYAEAASLFIPLSAAAVLALLGACGWMAWAWRREMGGELWTWAGRFRGGRGMAVWAGALVFAALALFWTSLGHFEYDTYNYHGPAIRWLEEYGVVKGLGNLHTRFAYNSAFLCLQALFSFSWALVRPVQAVNGFLWLAAVSWCWVGLLGKGNGGGLARLLKGVFFVMAAGWMREVAGPTTDFAAILAMGYACIKWCEEGEGDEREGKEALLGLLGVFAASVKLSAAVLGVFCLKTAWRLAAGRRWRGLAAYAATGMVAVVPFVARNVVLSGYLVYPICQLALPGVDWKIPEIVARTDAVAIQLCARDGLDWSYFDKGESLAEWWTKNKMAYPRWVEGVAMSVLVGFLAWGIFGVRRGRGKRERWGGWVGVAGFLYWVLTAPSLRFGMWWAGMGMAYWAWLACGWMAAGPSGGRRARAIAAGRWIFAVVCAAEFWHAEQQCRRQAGIPWGAVGRHWAMPGDYDEKWGTLAWMELGGRRFYYCKRTPQGPQDGGLNGYWGFPGTECRTTLERIEMRGKDLRNGFRVRKACDGVAYDFQGKLLSAEEASWFGLDALKQAEGAARLEPWNGIWWTQLGMARLATDDRPGAMAALERAAETGQWEAMNNLAWLYVEEGRVEEARAWMDQAMANGAARASVDAWDTEAVVRRAEGNEAGAREAEQRRDELRDARGAGDAA